MSFARPIMTFSFSGFMFRFSTKIDVGEQDVCFYSWPYYCDFKINGVCPNGRYTRDSYDRLMGLLK